jgi:hypothetical protein
VSGADPDLLAMAEDELARALTLSWRALSNVTPWGDRFEGITPGGRDVLVERAYLWAASPGGDILCEVTVFKDGAGALTGAKVSAVIERHAGTH